VLRFPRIALVVATVAVLALGLPALGMKSEPAGLNSLPQDIPEVRTTNRLQENFPSRGTTYADVVRAAASQSEEAVGALENLQQDAVRTGELVPMPGDSIRSAGDTAVLTVASPHPDSSQEAKDALQRLRDELAPASLGSLPGATWAVGGEVAESMDYGQHQRDQLPWVIAFVLGLTLLMMGITFRSVAIAVITTLLNLASVAACFGVLALVFQHTWAEGLLNFTSPGYVVSWVPLFLFVILVGLSMDYHVFVLGRIREGVQRGLPPREAVRHGITETAGVVTSAAAVMVSVFAVFATLGMIEMKQMGIGLAVAVLVDATLIRIVLLPSILVLLGRKAWWPARIRASQLAPGGTPERELAGV
jgi:RND superfamily putative drug exporter